MTFYQPQCYKDDGTNIDYIPFGMVFPTEEECMKWLEDNDYDVSEFSIIKRDDVEELIDETLEGINSIDSVEGMLNMFGSVRFIDEKIDDGCDDSEDEYVMMRSYDVTTEDNKTYYIRFYYGNITHEIGFFDIIGRNKWIVK